MAHFCRYDATVRWRLWQTRLIVMLQNVAETDQREPQTADAQGQPNDLAHATTDGEGQAFFTEVPVSQETSGDSVSISNNNNADTAGGRRAPGNDANTSSVPHIEEEPAAGEAATTEHLSPALADDIKQEPIRIEPEQNGGQDDVVAAASERASPQAKSVDF